MSEKYKYIRFVLLLSIGVTYLCFTQNKWSPVNGLYGGSVVSITLDSSNNLLAATEYNSILLSTNNGDYWSETNFPKTKLPLVLWSSSKMTFAGTNEGGIYKSTDEGQNWSYSGLSSASVLSITCSRNGVLFAGTSLYGLYRSTDNGLNWSYLGLAGYYVFSVVTTPNGNIFAGVQDSVVFRSTDNGTNWIRSVKPYYGMVDNGRVLTVDDVGNIYLGTSGGVWRSIDNGESWSTLGVNMPYVNGIAITDSSIFVCGIDGIQKANIDGKLWTTVDTLVNGVQTNSIIVTSKKSIITGSRWKGFTRSTNEGISWEKINNNFRNSDISSLTSDGKNIFAGITWDGVYSSSDNGNGWRHIWNSRNIPLAILADDSVLVVAPTNGNYGLFRSSDFGINWIQTSLSSGVFSCIAKSSDGTYYAGGGSGIDYGVYSSTDQGITWKYQLKDYSITGLFTTPLGNVFAITAIDGVFRSTDKGNNWAKVVFETGSPWRIVSSPSGDVYASFYDGYLYRLDDKSDTWDTVGGYFKSAVSNLLFLNDSTIVASTNNNGVVLSKDRGNSWNEINSGLPNSDITNLIMTKSGAVFLSIYHGGLYQSSDSTLTFIKEFISDIPVKIVLQNNYPNPFNPATIIKYQIPTNSFVSITVYDILGKEIAKLVNERLKAGNYSVIFDGTKYSSGIYFYRLQTNNFSETKKMLLIK
jgi:photosystem II stability/assembly factor-like uncharacterized protein